MAKQHKNPTTHMPRSHPSTRPLTLREAEYLPPRHLEPMHIVPWVVQLRVVGTVDTINIRISDLTTLLGRKTDNDIVQPDVDLSPYGAYELGVSRHHMTISATSDHLVVCDLHSNNGTYLNGKRLVPDEKVPIQHGDKLALGDLHLQVLFNVLPLLNDEQRAVSGEGQRILVVEDDADVAFAYRMMLEHNDYQVDTTNRLTDVLPTMKGSPPDLVITEMALDAMPYNDIDVIHLLHTELGKTVPIVVVSSMAAGHHRQIALASGAATFVEKPVRLDTLMDHVERLIRKDA